jgi:3-isopropylmalate/(R)-2-methylmalate dehydratase small subunit
MSIEKITEIGGTALPLRGDSIDTDRIIPARFLKSISFEGLEQHLFEDDRRQDGTHPVSNPAYAGSAVLLVNANFGCGSSREHAPQAIRRWGIRAVVGESFSEIFFGNSVAIGLVCLTAAHEDMERLQAAVEREPSTIVTVNLDTQTVSAGGVTAKATLPPAARESFLDGTWDATALLLDRFEEVEHVAGRLPYVGGWGA